MGIFRGTTLLTKRRAEESIDPTKVKKRKPTYLAATESEASVANQLDQDVASAAAPALLPGGAKCEIQCTFVGDSGTGKSTLLQAMGKKEKTQAATPSTKKTQEIFQRYCARVTSRTGELVNVKYCKASASEKHSRMRALSYQVTDVFFLCFSTVDRSSFENAKLEWFSEIDQLAPDAPVYLIGTKSDLRNAALEGSTTLPKGLVRNDEAHCLADELGAIKYIETQVSDKSEALTAVIKEVAEAVLRQVEHQQQQAEMVQESSDGEDWCAAYSNPPASSRRSSKMGTLRKYASIRRKSKKGKAKETPLSPKENHQMWVKLDAKKRKESFAVLSSTERDTITRKPLSDANGNRPGRKTRRKKPAKEEEHLKVEQLEVDDDIDMESVLPPKERKARVSIIDSEVFDAPMLDFCALPAETEPTFAKVASLDADEEMIETVEEASTEKVAEEAEEKENTSNKAHLGSKLSRHISIKKLRTTLHKMARRTTEHFAHPSTRARTTSDAKPYPDVAHHTESKPNVAVVAAKQIPAAVEDIGVASDATAVEMPQLEDIPSAADVAKEQEEPEVMTESLISAAPKLDRELQAAEPAPVTSTEAEENSVCEDDDDDDDDYDESDDEEDAVFCNW